MDAAKTAGFVLAGGRSSLMGRDKALLPYKGRTLLEHVVLDFLASIRVEPYPVADANHLANLNTPEQLHTLQIR